MRSVFLIAFGILLFSCGQSHQNEVMIDNNRLNYTELQENGIEAKDGKIRDTKNYKIENGIKFHARFLTAKAFLERTGVDIESSESQGIDAESILIFDVMDINRHKKIAQHDQLKLSDEALVSYLEAGILSDMTILQNDIAFYPNDVQLESMGSVQENKIRLLFFFTDIDLKKASVIQYNDKLFGNGLIRIKNV